MVNCFLSMSCVRVVDCSLSAFISHDCVRNWPGQLQASMSMRLARLTACLSMHVCGRLPIARLRVCMVGLVDCAPRCSHGRLLIARLIARAIGLADRVLRCSCDQLGQLLALRRARLVADCASWCTCRVSRPAAYLIN